MTKRAFTIPEVLIAALIMSLVFVATLGLFAQAFELSKKTALSYTAVNLAKNRLELARSMVDAGEVTDLPDLEETDTVVDASGGSDPEGEYKRTTTVTSNYGGKARLIKVDVVVAYKYRRTWMNTAAITVTTVYANTN
ncbi:MAG: type II secretion system protein [Candidatus Omnitrophota bacterium]